MITKHVMFIVKYNIFITNMIYFFKKIISKQQGSTRHAPKPNITNIATVKCSKPNSSENEPHHCHSSSIHARKMVNIKPRF